MSAVPRTMASMGIGCCQSPAATNWEEPAKTSALMSAVSSGLMPFSAQSAPMISAKGMTAISSGSICQAPSRNSSFPRRAGAGPASGIEGDAALEIADGLAADFHPVAGKLAGKIADAPGNLPAGQLLLAKPSRPIGHEGALGHARGGIFRNAGLGDEKTGDIIDAVQARRRGDDAVAVKCCERRHVGGDRRHLRGVVENGQILRGSQQGAR